MSSNLSAPVSGPVLRPFQNEGCKFVERKNGRALIGDDMGLGKTIQSLAYLQRHPELRPALIVCPAGLKLNWLEEAKIWFDGDVQILNRKNPTLGPDLNICSYATAVKYRDQWLSANALKIMIMDEAHSIKDISTKRTKAIKELSNWVPQVVGLTGTPMVNRPGELFPILNVIRPDLFPSWPLFMKIYGVSFRGKWKKGPKARPDLLRQDLQAVMIRRMKKDVLPELPDKARYVVRFELNNPFEYEEAKLDIVQWIRENEGPEKAVSAARASAIVKIEKLKQIALRGKLTSAVDWIQDFIDSGQKLVVFATHNDVISYLKLQFGECAVTLSGKNTLKQRQEAVRKFQTDPSCTLFLANLKAGGVGYNLTAASNTAFIEIGWTPGEHDQAEDRPNRIGQTANKVAAWYLIADNTIERWLAEIIDEKRTQIKEVLDGKEIEERELLVRLLNKILESCGYSAAS